MCNPPTGTNAVIRQQEAERAPPKFYTLAQVTRAVRKHLEPAIKKPPFWLRAEIASGREKGGAFFCELVETDDAGNQVAAMRATIWQIELSTIRQKFDHAGLNLQLDDGTAVGILCSLQFHSRYGLSLKILDADPAFALGELELRRRELLLRLETDGHSIRPEKRPKYRNETGCPSPSFRSVRGCLRRVFQNSSTRG